MNEEYINIVEKLRILTEEHQIIVDKLIEEGFVNWLEEIQKLNESVFEAPLVEKKEILKKSDLSVSESIRSNQKKEEEKKDLTKHMLLKKSNNSQKSKENEEEEEEDGDGEEENEGEEEEDNEGEEEEEEKEGLSDKKIEVVKKNRRVINTIHEVNEDEEELNNLGTKDKNLKDEKENLKPKQAISEKIMKNTDEIINKQESPLDPSHKKVSETSIQEDIDKKEVLSLKSLPNKSKESPILNTSKATELDQKKISESNPFQSKGTFVKSKQGESNYKISGSKRDLDEKSSSEKASTNSRLEKARLIRKQTTIKSDSQQPEEGKGDRFL